MFYGKVQDDVFAIHNLLCDSVYSDSCVCYKKSFHTKDHLNFQSYNGQQSVRIEKQNLEKQNIKLP